MKIEYYVKIVDVGNALLHRDALQGGTINVGTGTQV